MWEVALASQGRLSLMRVGRSDVTSRRSALRTYFVVRRQPRDANIDIRPKPIALSCQANLRRTMGGQTVCAEENLDTLAKGYRGRSTEDRRLDRHDHIVKIRGNIHRIRHDADLYRAVATPTPIFLPSGQGDASVLTPRASRYAIVAGESVQPIPVLTFIAGHANSPPYVPSVHGAAMMRDSRPADAIIRAKARIGGWRLVNPILRSVR